MKTNRYVTQSAVVLGLFALLTVPQVVGQADEATAPVPTTSTETVADPVSGTASTAGSANVSGNSSLPDTAQMKKDSSGTDIKSPQCGEKNCFTLLLEDFIEIFKKILIFLGFSSKI